MGSLDTTNITYRVSFAHENAAETDPKKRYGFGSIEIDTDHAITGEADTKEIAKQIGKNGGYTKVVITQMLQKVVDE